MTARRVVAAGLAAAALALGCAACDDQAGSSGSSQGADELSQVQTTLDAIDSEVAGDGSP